MAMAMHVAMIRQQHEDVVCVPGNMNDMIATQVYIHALHTYAMCLI